MKHGDGPYTVLRMLAAYTDYVACGCQDGKHNRKSRTCARADARKWVSRMRMHVRVMRYEVLMARRTKKLNKSLD